MVLLLSNMKLNTGTVVFFQSFTIFSGFFTYNYCGLIFCLAKPLTGKCSEKIVRLKVAKLQLNLDMLSQIWDSIFFTNFEPCNYQRRVTVDSNLFKGYCLLSSL